MNGLIIDGICPAGSAGSRPATIWRTNVPPQPLPFGSVDVQLSTALPSDCAAIEALKSSEQASKNLCPLWIVVSILGGSTSNWPQLGVANDPLPLKPYVATFQRFWPTWIEGATKRPSPVSIRQLVTVQPNCPADRGTLGVKDPAIGLSDVNCE